MARPCRCRQTRGSRHGKNPVPLIDLGTLVARLGPVCRRALEAAAGAALSRTRYNVAIKHWLLQLLDATRGSGMAAANWTSSKRHKEVAMP